MEYLEKLSKAVTAKDIKVKFIGTQASTNGRSITLPMLGNNIDDTTKTILNGYCDHETGHCLYTDWNASRSVMYDKELMNIR